ncbi:MAG TPA: hypothetical protein VM364_18575 [Vicinamibacterales bacterium]|nr:hypothetical protein [Vicinamibacterales bacterium]
METIDEWADLARYVASNPNNDFGPLACETVYVAWQLGPDSMAAWLKLARWVRFVTNWNERYRPLTDDEQRLRRIACDLLAASDRVTNERTH